MKIKQKTSLFQHSALTISLGLLAFQLIAGIAIFINMVMPLAQRSADDLASLLIWSGQIWQQSPPQQRKTLEQELLNHGLSIKKIEKIQTETNQLYPYIQFLTKALQKRLPENKPALSILENSHEHFQVQFYAQTQLLQFNFDKSQLTPKPSAAILWIIMTGIITTLFIAALLAKSLTAPIKRLTKAARHIGQGEKIKQLPETDIAELSELTHIFNKMEQQLLARQENQTTLLAGVSHDLRSPLARIKMAIGLLPEQHSSLIQRIEHDITEMDSLIGAQLELARAQEQEARKHTNIDQLLQDIVDACSAQAPGRLQLKNKPKGTIRIAPVTLRRCLDNLINNALRYSEQGKVDVVCRNYKNTTCIAIRDRGPGIPTHLHDVVFRPFFRIESSRNRTTGGSGLGLAITQQLANTQGWQLKLKPRYKGGLSVWLLISDSV